jgi:hypothetical protein
LSYPKIRERERMLNGVHAAPGRQVSTWVHVVKAEESARVGGRSPFFHPPSNMFGLCHQPLNLDAHLRNHSLGKKDDLCYPVNLVYLHCKTEFVP